MADDAFALSPISARATMPTEADYDAICEAFMETSRGRWFLSEYAKRNRNADTRVVLDAVARIESMLDERKAPAPAIDPALMDAARELMTQTRAQLVQALHASDAAPAADTSEAVKRAGQMVQGVAWTLREIGSDGRICAILDEQAQAIARHCDLMAAQPQSAREAMAVFDAMRYRFDEMTGHSASSAAPDSAPSQSDTPQAAAPMAATPGDQAAEASASLAADIGAVSDMAMQAGHDARFDNQDGADPAAASADAAHDADDIATGTTMFPFAHDALKAGTTPLSAEPPLPPLPPLGEFDDVEWTGDTFGIRQEDAVGAAQAPDLSQPTSETDAAASAPAPLAEPHGMATHAAVEVIELDDIPAIMTLAQPMTPQSMTLAQPMAPPPLTLGDAILATSMSGAANQATADAIAADPPSADPMAALRKMTPIEKIALFS